MTEHVHRSAVCLAFWAGACVFSVEIAAASAPDTALGVSHGHFVFRSVESDRALVRALERLADRAWERVTADLAGAPAAPITVVLAPDDAAFNQFQPPGEPLPEWASGVAYPGTMTMVIRSYHVAGSPRQDVGTIFVHELTHLVLGARFGARSVPSWLHEGLAMYEAGEWQFEHEWDLVWAVLANRVPRLETLSSEFGKSEAEARTAYLLSEALVGHMIATYGRQSFGAFVDQLAAGRSFEGALIGAFSVSPSRFEERWRAHLDRRYAWIPLITSSSALWAIVMGVTFAAYLARRRRNRRIRAEWVVEAEREAETPPE